MKYILEYNNYYPSKEIDKGYYAIMTQELSDRLTPPIKMTQGYLFAFYSSKERTDLENKYKVGGSYKEEIISQISVFDDKENMN